MYRLYSPFASARTVCPVLFIDDFGGDSDFLEEEEKQQRLRKVIRILTPRTRHILEECYIRKKKYQEVADELEISVSAVRKHIMKALQAMRDEFAKKE